MAEPTEEKTATVTTTIEPLPVTVIGVRTADSGAPIADGQIVQTPDHQPNLVVKVVRPVVAIAIRAAFIFVKTLLGGLGLTTGAQVTGAIPWATWHLALVFALTAAGVEVLWSLVTVLGDLEKRHPLLTGSV